MPIDFQLGPFYLAAAMTAAWLSSVVITCEGRHTWLAAVLRLLAFVLMARFGWLVVGGSP